MIIGVVGFIGSGKGAVGDILNRKYSFHKTSFAKPLKDACAKIFFWPRELLEGDTEESRKWREKVDLSWSKALNYPDFTPRLALQLLGTEAGRKVFGEDLWAVSCVNQLATHVDWVITDVRFQNEIRVIREHGGILVRVTRGDDPEWVEKLASIEGSQNREAYMSEHYPKIHQSEWDWAGCEPDYTIVNDGSLADLESKVEILLRRNKHWSII